ncbi:MAG TPA: putative metal-binding motif-containing protein [Polyangiaceae bacterium]|jgi:hypothetical protein|nr:putative metal-binding motif-containing protein [Polyangiaceae bacterium]
MSRTSSKNTPRRDIMLVSLVIAGVAGAAVTVSCSSSFSSCAASQTCAAPSAGAAGMVNAGGSGGGTQVGDDAGGSDAVGGEGGAAGASPQPQCARDADCSDSLACNGMETCSAGVCQSGVPPCANPDPTDCDVSCTELNGAASCLVKAQDKDQDGYGSSACAAAPGDDCNDNDPAVHPGAKEICDGIDNDCNGKIDVNDGLPFSGKNTVLASVAGGGVAAAWLASGGVYGVTWVDYGPEGDTPSYEFAAFDSTGKVVVADEPVVSFSVGSDAGSFPPAISAGDSAFAIAWNSDASVVFRRVTAAGAVDANSVVHDVQSAAPLAVIPAMVGQVPGGDWLLPWASSSLTQPLTGVAIDPTTENVTQEMSLAPTGVGVVQAVLGVGAQGALLAYVDKTGAVWSSVRSTSLASSLGGGQLDSSSGNVQVASASASFGVAWNKGSDVVFTNLKSDGTELCAATHLTVGATVVVSKIIATGNGFLILFSTDSGATTSLVPVSNTCEFGAPVPLGFGAPVATIAGNATTGYAVVFGAGAGLSERQFGPLFCN